MTINADISAGIEEIKQMLLGMQQRNKQFWDEQAVQIRSLRHTFNEGAAELSRLHTLVSEQTEAIENPGSVETPHNKAKEDDYDIPTEKEAVDENVKVVVELAAPVMAVFKVPLILQYNCATVEKIAEYVELHPPPLVRGLKTLGNHCMPSVCGNVTVRFHAYFVSSWRLRIHQSPLYKPSVQGLLVWAGKPPPLPPEIALSLSNTVLGVPFSSMFELRPLNLDVGDQSELYDCLHMIFKHNTMGSKGSLYYSVLLPMNVPLKKRVLKLESVGRMFLSKTIVELVYSLSSLFPSFCNYVTETTQSYNRLEKSLYQYLRQQADIRVLICAYLYLTIEQNKNVLEGKDSDLSGTDLITSTQDVMAYRIAQNMRVNTLSVWDLMAVLSELFLQFTKDAGLLQFLMSKPLIETVRKQYIPAISTSSYSSISLLKHLAPITNLGCNLRYVTRDGRKSESLSSSKVLSSFSVTPSLRSEKEILQASNLKSFTFVNLRPTTKDSNNVLGEGGSNQFSKDGSMRRLLLLANLELTWSLP